MRRRTAERAWAHLPISYTVIVTVSDANEPKQDDVPFWGLEEVMEKRPEISCCAQNVFAEEAEPWIRS